MIRILLLGVIMLAVVGGVGYFIFFQKPSINEPNVTGFDLRNLTSKTSSSTESGNLVDNLIRPSKTPKPTSKVSSTGSSSSNVENRIEVLENTVIQLQTRVAILEQTSPSPAAQQSSSTSNKYPLYIPLGSGGQAGDKGWFSVNQYQVSIDPGQYPGYTSMQLEVNLRLLQKSGTGYARLFNSSDNSAVSSSEVSTTTDQFGLFTSSGFTLTSGSKIYKMQIKSSEGVELQIESARIKVIF